MMNFQKYKGIVVIIILGIMAIKPLQAQDTLKILAWNIYMLPKAIRKSGQMLRVEPIAKALNDAQYDILILQETFYRKAKCALSTALKSGYPYQVGPANNKKRGIKLNSGVMIFSKSPIDFVEEIQFKRSSGPDKMARKGALMVSLKKNKKNIQIVGTHLQADESNKKDKIRISQYAEINQLLQKNVDAADFQILAGDFNTKKSDNKLYNIMIDTLQVSDASLEGDIQYSYNTITNDLSKNKKTYHEILDYIFIKNNKLNSIHTNRKVVAFTNQWHKKHKDLSDHYAVEATIIY